MGLEPNPGRSVHLQPISAAEKPLRSFSPPFIQRAQHWETQCLFEVMLYFELLHGNMQAFPLQRGEFVLQINEERGSFFSDLFLCYNNHQVSV